MAHIPYWEYSRDRVYDPNFVVHLVLKVWVQDLGDLRMEGSGQFLNSAGTWKPSDATADDKNPAWLYIPKP